MQTWLLSNICWHPKSRNDERHYAGSQTLQASRATFLLVLKYYSFSKAFELQRITEEIFFQTWRKSGKNPNTLRRINSFNLASFMIKENSTKSKGNKAVKSCLILKYLPPKVLFNFFFSFYLHGLLLSVFLNRENTLKNAKRFVKVLLKHHENIIEVTDMFQSESFKDISPEIHSEEKLIVLHCFRQLERLWSFSRIIRPKWVHEHNKCSSRKSWRKGKNMERIE